MQESCLTSDDDTDVETDTQKNTMSRKSVAKLYKFFRDVICDHMMNVQLNGRKIGGPGLTVEIDESLFGEIYVPASLS